MATPAAIRQTPQRIGGLAVRSIANALRRLFSARGRAHENTTGDAQPAQWPLARRGAGGPQWSDVWSDRAIKKAHAGLLPSGDIECALPFVLPERLAASILRAAESSDGAGVDAEGSREVDGWVRDLPPELRARVERAILDRGARGLPATFLRLEAEELGRAVSAASDPILDNSCGDACAPVDRGRLAIDERARHSRARAVSWMHARRTTSTRIDPFPPSQTPRPERSGDPHAKHPNGRDQGDDTTPRGRT